ncbi:MAG TPA: deoxyhypusine synthase family protein [Blastocatellia bacterium]|nr:deoxyhypusine synthase family protein [Blastocatellia bacterium]
MIRRLKGAKYLTKPTQPLNVDRDRSVPGLLEKMEHISFQGRNLAIAHQIWLQMLAENALVIMGLSGALVPAGMRRLVSYLIKNRYIDVLVCTGANLYHDLHETLGRHHYIGDPGISDAELQEQMVDRIYDTYASEEEFREANEWIGGFAAQLDNTHAYSTREFLHLLGRELSEIATEDGILTSAYKSRVPIFCPAITDSAFGVSIAISRIEKKNPFQFDVLQDVVELGQVVSKVRSTGVVFFGGGTPKTFVQQSESTASALTGQTRGHKFAVQITTESPHYGSYSGADFDQAQSFGRLARNARAVTVRCDATIAMPMLVTSLSQTASKALRTRKRVQFTFARDLNIQVP